MFSLTHCMKDFEVGLETCSAWVFYIGLTWVSWSTDIPQKLLHAFPIRLTLPREASSCCPIFFDHPQHECQHEQCASWGTAHLQSSCLDLHVVQWEMQCKLIQSSWMASNNTAPSMMTATIMTVLPTLIDNKRAMSCPLHHVIRQGYMSMVSLN